MDHPDVFVINLGRKNDLKKVKVEFMATTVSHLDKPSQISLRG